MGDKLPKDYKVYIPLTILFVLLVLLMPRSTSFNYKYSKGAPGMYQTLVAEFDFPILKTGAELLLDDDLSILIHSMPSKLLVFLLPAGVPQPIQFYSRQD